MFSQGGGEVKGWGVFFMRDDGDVGEVHSGALAKVGSHSGMMRARVSSESPDVEDRLEGMGDLLEMWSDIYL